MTYLSCTEILRDKWAFEALVASADVIASADTYGDAVCVTCYSFFKVSIVESALVISRVSTKLISFWFAANLLISSMIVGNKLNAIDGLET